MNQPTLEVVREANDGVLLSWNVKELMHKNAGVAKKDIRRGKKVLGFGARSVSFRSVRAVPGYGDEVEEYERQKREFQERPELERVLMEFDLPLIPVLYEMEEYGMLIDVEYFKALKREFEGGSGKVGTRFGRWLEWSLTLIHQCSWPRCCLAD